MVGAALAYALWFRGIGGLSAPAVSFLGLLSPLVAALLGAAVLAQTLTGWQLVGFALALAGILGGQLQPAAGRRRTAGSRRSAAGAVRALGGPRRPCAELPAPASKH